jgi:predicted Zn-dependent protease
MWAKQNGYDPNGAVRLFQALEKKSGNSAIPFFQSHPNPNERIENAQKFINSGN